MSENAFFPLVIYYMTKFYRRGELARCLAVFYAAQSIASAFSGLLASWRYLFLIEGVGTVVFGLIGIYPDAAGQLCSCEREAEHPGFFQNFKHGTSWAILGIQIRLGVPLQSVQLFLPVIIARLKYSTVKTNLYTVAPNVSGAVVLLILAFCSD
ncbi:Major facilitator superfamily, general substrate transporter [Penicillium camemberti]|uniref:Major facilitator superfamily, general substrate transporter n=1 Tax=Penicillium camemberti (strain FM 013) TaxID=1429867 RepID=A0A0G4PMM0_PENC3|nr:Major facilitator superfamily, general substrate transporter [Penicillium camemberti]